MYEKALSRDSARPLVPMNIRACVPIPPTLFSTYTYRELALKLALTLAFANSSKEQLQTKEQSIRNQEESIIRGCGNFTFRFVNRDLN